MTDLNKLAEQREIKQQHANWLRDYEQWQAEHRDALKKLAAIQIAMLEREEALAAELKQVRQHQAEMGEYELLGIEQFGTDPDRLIEKHAECKQQHKNLQLQHQKAKALHEAIVQQIQALCDALATRA